jgi:hypothetical protein
MDLIGAEIFATGKWNNLEFTDKDIDEIIANFDSLHDIHKVPLKLGHNDEQNVSDGQPALGWVQRVYKKGNKLLADFVDMPKTIHEAIKNRLYRSVSVELLFNVDHKGTKYNHVLDAVAILGADHPAVNTLADLDVLLASQSGMFSGGRRVIFETSVGKRKSTKEENEMDEKQVEKLIASAVKPLEDANKELREDLKAVKADNEKLTKEKADFAAKRKEESVAAKRKEVTDILNEAVKDDRMTPAVRETYSKQIGLEDDEKVLDIDVGQVKIMCNATKGAGDDEEEGLHKKSGTVKDPEQELTILTRKAMAESGESDFAAAFARVAPAYPELHKAYLDGNGILADNRRDD